MDKGRLANPPVGHRLPCGCIVTEAAWTREQALQRVLKQARVELEKRFPLEELDRMPPLDGHTSIGARFPPPHDRALLRALGLQSEARDIPPNLGAIAERLYQAHAEPKFQQCPTCHTREHVGND